MKKFCVYEHWRPDTDKPFYVGKGLLRRAYNFSRNVHYNNVVAKLKRLGLNVEVRIYADELEEELAFAIEMERISIWKVAGVLLTNMTNGGEGISGGHGPLSEEHKRKISKANKGRKCSEEAIQAKRVAAKNRNFGAETDVHAKISKKVKALWQTPEYRSKLKAAHKNRPSMAEEIKEKLRAKFTGRFVSEETKETTRASITAWHARRRLLLLPETSTLH